MKAITIKQPWASLIVHGIKDIENRTWKTNFRGRILIHAGCKKDTRPKPLLTEEQYKLTGGVSGYGRHIFGDLGAIIGSVEIVDCVQNYPSAWAEKGVWNWVLANPILFDEPITDVKGCLGLWNYEINAEKQVSYGKKEAEYECTNNNSSGLNEYKEGCRQHCDDCDYYQPIQSKKCKL